MCFTQAVIEWKDICYIIKAAYIIPVQSDMFRQLIQRKKTKEKY